MKTLLLLVTLSMVEMALVFPTVAQSQSTTDKKRKERSEYETELQKLKRDKPTEYENNRKDSESLGATSTGQARLWYRPVQRCT